MRVVTHRGVVTGKVVVSVCEGHAAIETITRAILAQRSDPTRNPRIAINQYEYAVAERNTAYTPEEIAAAEAALKQAVLNVDVALARCE